MVYLLSVNGHFSNSQPEHSSFSDPQKITIFLAIAALLIY